MRRTGRPCLGNWILSTKPVFYVNALHTKYVRFSHAEIFGQQFARVGVTICQGAARLVLCSGTIAYTSVPNFMQKFSAVLSAWFCRPAPLLATVTRMPYRKYCIGRRHPFDSCPAGLSVLRHAFYHDSDIVVCLIQVLVVQRHGGKNLQTLARAVREAGRIVYDAPAAVAVPAGLP